jgi:hypothetical protein
MIGGMLFAALLIALGSFPAVAGDWPTIDDLYVGDVFKYPLVGEPKGHEVRPTQEGAGMRAVRKKEKDFARMGHDELKRMLENDPVPVVAAPDGRFYMIDHHHQSLAAHGVGRENAFFLLHTDYSKLPGGTGAERMAEFWRRMKAKKWVREFDHAGRPIDIPDGLPKSILGMKDDPYRSLAWYVRKDGGYRKTNVEFAEFLWADFFRARVDLGTSDDDFEAAIRKAVRIAHTADAKELPGWSAKAVDCKSHLSR